MITFGWPVFPGFWKNKKGTRSRKVIGDEMGSRLEPPIVIRGLNVERGRVLDGVLEGGDDKYRGHGRNSFPVEGFAIPRSIEKRRDLLKWAEAYRRPVSIVVEMKLMSSHGWQGREELGDERPYDLGPLGQTVRTSSFQPNPKRHLVGSTWRQVAEPEWAWVVG